MSIKEVGIEIEKRSPKETMLEIAHGSTFLFFALKLSSSKEEDSIVELKVSPEIYDRLQRGFHTDTFPFYFDIRSGKMEAWTPDMIFTLNSLQEYDIMSSFQDWISLARPYIAKNINKEIKVEEIHLPEEKIHERLKKTKELLSYADILEKIENRNDLLAIARDVSKTGMKDTESIVYRLAMMLFHSARMAGEPAIAELEDSGSIYLNLTENEDFSKNYPKIVENLKKIPHQARSAVTKTFISFVAAAYIYYTAMGT